MKVLMFGWEFPPKIYGGLAVASYGITKGLSLQGDIETTFCMPKPTGEEEKFLKIVNMSQVPIVWRDVQYDNIKDRIVGHTAEDYYRFRDHIYADFNYMQGLDDLGCMGFAGGYPGNLHDEINNFSIIAGVLARSEQFDIIHAHDWLTYPAGVHAKIVSGKPLCIHVHATDFDRSRGNVNPTVYSIEKNGMDNADCIMCVSELTRQTVINQYHQDPRKCVAPFILSHRSISTSCLTRSLTRRLLRISDALPCRKVLSTSSRQQSSCFSVLTRYVSASPVQVI